MLKTKTDTPGLRNTWSTCPELLSLSSFIPNFNPSETKSWENHHSELHFFRTKWPYSSIVRRLLYSVSSSDPVLIASKLEMFNPCHPTSGGPYPLWKPARHPPWRTSGERGEAVRARNGWGVSSRTDGIEHIEGPEAGWWGNLLQGGALYIVGKAGWKLR